MSEARARWTATVLLAAAAIMAPGAPAVRADGLRDFNTDRPDTTESPFTIDRGHAQIELSLAEKIRVAAHLKRRVGDIEVEVKPRGEFPNSPRSGR